MKRILRVLALAVVTVALSAGVILGIGVDVAGASGYTPATTSAVVTAKATIAAGGTLRAAFCAGTSGSGTNVVNQCSVTQPAYTRATSVASATRSDALTPATIVYWDGIAPGQTVALGVNDLYATNEGTGAFVVTYGSNRYGSAFERFAAGPPG